MNMTDRKPTHPGGVLRRQHLDILGISISDFAARLGVSRKTLSKLLNERGAVTPDMALRLSRALGTSPEVWLNLQQKVDLWNAAHTLTGWQEVAPVSREEHRAE